MVAYKIRVRENDLQSNILQL